MFPTFGEHHIWRIWFSTTSVRGVEYSFNQLKLFEVHIDIFKRQAPQFVSQNLKLESRLLFYQLFSSLLLPPQVLALLNLARTVLINWPLWCLWLWWWSMMTIVIIASLMMIILVWQSFNCLSLSLLGIILSDPPSSNLSSKHSKDNTFAVQVSGTRKIGP